jgi:S1-C subfamily serine protease
LAAVNNADLRPRWLNRKRAAALCFGLGATLALSPLVWAENPSVSATPAQGAPQTMTSPVALIQQQSFAPLVKKVLPAVVNISVSQKTDGEAMVEEQEPELAPSPGFPNSPSIVLAR